jgi:hypothetical protein
LSGDTLLVVVVVVSAAAAVAVGLQFAHLMAIISSLPARVVRFVVGICTFVVVVVVVLVDDVLEVLVGCCSCCVKFYVLKAARMTRVSPTRAALHVPPCVRRKSERAMCAIVEREEEGDAGCTFSTLMMRPSSSVRLPPSMASCASVSEPIVTNAKPLESPVLGSHTWSRPSRTKNTNNSNKQIKQTNKIQ